MKKLSFLIFFAAVLFSAQNQRFIYEYKFSTDSTNKENVEKELMYLDITKDGSKFYSREVYVTDSTMNAYYEKQIQATGRMDVDSKMSFGGGKVRYKVFKTYPNYKTFFITRNAMDAYKVLDNRPINWKILPEKEKIGDWETQKATTEMYGRKWTAWFATEIPLQDGPYKFHGLPGLIVKISDASNSHVFELKAATKFKEEIGNISDFYGGGNAIEVNQNQYKKLFLDDRNDPAKFLRQLVANGATLQFTDGSGKQITATEMIKIRENSAKENNLKNNNLLELDLLK